MNKNLMIGAGLLAVVAYYFRDNLAESPKNSDLRPLWTQRLTPVLPETLAR